MKRRNYLATIGSAGTVILSGCSGDGNPESSTFEFTLATETGSNRLQETVTIESGEYQSYTLTVPHSAQVSCTIEVVSGSEVNLFTMPAEEFDQYRNNNKFSFYQRLSAESRKSISVQGEIAQGDYQFVVDRVSEFSNPEPTGRESTGFDLEIINREYYYSESRGFGTEFLTVQNSGVKTNIIAYVDLVSLVSTEEVNKGEVIETYDRTGIVDSGEAKEIAVEIGHYLNSGVYERSVGIEPTKRPHATFEVVSEEAEVVRADASEAVSVESSIALA